MTIGEALAEARDRAGLTVDELSERTRIRETVIRCIEQDDYAACGGDLYVRGYVRAIAGAVGIDAQPLIRDYDAGRSGAAAGTRNASAQDLAGSAITTVTEPPALAEPPTVTESSAVAEPPAVTDLPSAVADPEQPRQPSARRARIRSRRWVTGVAVLVVMALAVAGFAGSRIVSHLRDHNAAGNMSAVQQRKAVSNGAQGGGAKTAPGPVIENAAARQPATHTAPKAPDALPVRQLPIRLAMAFGPDGTADGDNPQSAQFAIIGGSPSPWQTDWYVTPVFGMLKKATGLLLDMGTMVTVTSVRIDLSPYRGADLQLKVGEAPSGLRVAAHADDVGGTVRLELPSPLHARYVLIWFTLLPPNGAGQYQESVYRAVVDGRP